MSSKATISDKTRELDPSSRRLPTWLKEMLEKEFHPDITITQRNSTPEAEVATGDDDESSALCKRASKEQQQGQLFKAIDTYVQVIRIQLGSHELRASSPSRQAMSQICEILIQVFPRICRPSYSVWGWWLSDTLEMRWTLTDSVSKMPQWPLSSGAIDAFQILADYIVKWYAPDALSCAALLYERILTQLDGEFSFSRDTRRAHVVKELAKVYVEELSMPYKSGEDVSLTKHTIIGEGRRQIEKCDIFEQIQFYQNLGALYVRKAGKDPQCDGIEGEKILQRIYNMQKQLFGHADYRCVRTVDILSQYYVEQGGRDIEAAQLIEDVFMSGDQPPPEDGDSEAGDDDEVEDRDEIKHVEVAGGERKRKAIEKWKESVILKDTRVTSLDYEFQDILRSQTLQARLMSLLAPPTCAWQDSRLYLSDINEIQFRRVTITDTLENYPVRVTRLSNGEVDVQVPIAAHLFTNDKDMSTRVSEAIGFVRASHFYELLRSDAAADHFAAQWRGTIPEWQANNNTNWTTNSGVRNWTNDIQPDLATSDVDQVFWVFPRDLKTAEVGEQAHEDSIEDGDISGNPTKKWLDYQFQKLPDQLEWMVVVTEWTEIKLPYWRVSPGGESHNLTYQHYIRNTSWDWVLSDDLVWSINEAGDSRVSVVCPYVAYEEIRQIRGFGSGFTYSDFMQQLRSSRGMEDTSNILEIKKAMCKEWTTETTKELPTIVFDEAHQTLSYGTSKKDLQEYHQSSLIDDHEKEGFFNNIPGSGAWVHCENLIPSFNLVSSSWVDWKAFVVNDSSLTTVYPKLRSSNGEPITCRGYIDGSWIPSNLEGKYDMERVFVIDAVFIVNKGAQTRRDFVFCLDTYIMNSRVELTSTEKRCLIGNLNPSVFRCIEPDDEPMVKASWIKKRKKTLQQDLTYQERMMEELKRREGLTLDYEQKRKECQGDDAMLKKIEIEHELEREKWTEWDKKQKLMIANLMQMSK
ncbi:hypothetical protein F4678DRAFT_458351 [Xylaria arbuscula]|nr:hypothetical protein F4678DRAFT_458351 [Xylaria arbuscula]